MANSKTDLPKTGLDLSKREMPFLSPSGHHEHVDGAASSATSAETFYPGQIVRVLPISTIAYMKYGTGTAATTDIAFSPDKMENIKIKAATKLSFIGAKVDLVVML